MSALSKKELAIHKSALKDFDKAILSNKFIFTGDKSDCYHARADLKLKVFGNIKSGISDEIKS